VAFPTSQTASRLGKMPPALDVSGGFGKPPAPEKSH
jgi:hypothetical protein